MRQTLSSPVALLAVSAVLVLLGGSAADAEPNVQQQKVAPAAQDVRYEVSPLGVHLACVQMAGSRWTVTLDGVPGPKFDEVYRVTPTLNRQVSTNAVNVVFSPDGQHAVYAGRVGTTCSIYVDGKPVCQLPVSSDPRLCAAFAGTHLFVSATHGTDLVDLWVDGKPSAVPYNQAITPAVTPDGAHAVYTGTPDETDRKHTVLVVDGQPASYNARDPQITSTGHVVCVSAVADGEAVLIDGKPLASGPRVEKIWLPPVGDRAIAVFARPKPGGAEYYAVVDGAEIAGTAATGAPSVVFSPDGKRYVVTCKPSSNAAGWAVVDGKKGQEYLSVSADTVRFTGDSTKVVYTAFNGKSFVVADGQESEAFEPNPWIAFAPATNRLAYGGLQRGAQVVRSVVVDGTAVRGDFQMDTSTFTFSPDGSRWAMIYSGPLGHGLMVDGKLLPGYSVSKFLFSPDGKHIAFIGQRQAGGQNGLFLDGQALFTPGGANRLAFSPDGKHLFWSVTQPMPGTTGGPMQQVVYVDGKPTAHFDNIATGAFPMSNAWQTGPTGALTCLGPVGSDVMRVTVEPDATTDVSTAATALEADRQKQLDAAAQAKADAAQAKADAAAAKAKARADAAAAAAAARAAKRKH